MTDKLIIWLGVILEIILMGCLLFINYLSDNEILLYIIMGFVAIGSMILFYLINKGIEEEIERVLE